MSDKPISTQSNQNNGRGCLIVIGGLFFVIGMAFFWFEALNPLIQSKTSGHWQETPCKIIASKVDVRESDDGKSYRAKIEFEFKIDGQQHVSDTYDFTNLNRSKARCNEIVAQHRVGSETVCFVNPDDFDQAVIVRGYDFSWFAILFPLVFALIGLGMLLRALFQGKKSNSVSGRKRGPIGSVTNQLASNRDDSVTSAAGQHPGDVEDQIWDVPQNLKPKKSRVTSLIFVLIFATIWNVVVSGLIFESINNFTIINFLFMLPFAFVGLMLIGGVIYTLAALLNPTVELALSAGAVRRGDSVDVAWQLKGRTASIRALTVSLEGKESATYQRGTDTKTEHHVFCTIDIAEITDQEEMGFGSRSVTIPADTMHTFDARRNKVVWTVVVHGDIPLWPSIKENFEFRVKP